VSHLVSEAAAERAIVTLKRAIEAAENSNQAGEDFVVAAAAGQVLLEALILCEDIIDDFVGHLSPKEQEADSDVGAALAKARSAIDKARGDA